METSVNQVTLSHPPGELAPCTENRTVGRMDGMFERINKMIEQQAGVPSCIPDMLKEDTKYFPLLKDVLKPRHSGTTSEPRAQ